MAISASDPKLGDVDLLRSGLEIKVTQLRKSLQTWRTWEAEYEGLKEEIQGLDGEPSRDELVSLGRDFGGSLIDEKEMQGLLQASGKAPRTARQVVNLLSRRIDYVHRNVESVEKQSRLVEQKLSDLFAVQESVDHEGKDTSNVEILEELDEEGHVVSSTTADTGKAAAQILQSLRNAGVTDEEDQNGSSPAVTQNQAAANNLSPVKGDEKAVSVKSVEPRPGIIKGKDLSPKDGAKFSKTKKSVRFSEDTKPEAAPVVKPLKPARSKKKKKKSGNGAGSSKQNRKVTQHISQDQDVDLAKAVIPKDEPPEDAELRKEMLEYNMSGLGAVVAELDILEDQDDSVGKGEVMEVVDHEDLSADDWIDEDEDENKGDEDEDDEDEWGRSTRRIISAAYRKEMEALQKRIAARETQKDRPDDTDALRDQTSIPSTASKPATDQEEEEADPKQPSTANPPPAPETTDPESERQRPGKVVADTIIEHPPADPDISHTSSQTTSTTLSTNLPIREATMPGATAAAAAAAFMEDTLEPDFVDPALLRQQVAVEYNNSVNRMIYRRGGFLAQNEDDVLAAGGMGSRDGEDQEGGAGEGEVRVPLDAPEESSAAGERGTKRKMSRFKAARLGL